MTTTTEERAGTIPATHDYLRDGTAIYERSFAIIRAEADLSRFSPLEAHVAVRMIHAAGLAERMGTTRSAAAIELWGERLTGSLVVIGNAPTALFHLIDAIAAGGPRPAAIIGAPVGFVGAAESKAALAESAIGVPWLVVDGRLGGSAIASAAVNALASDRL